MMKNLMVIVLAIIGIACAEKNKYVQAPVTIINPDAGARTAIDKEKIIEAVARHFNLTKENSPYLKAKVKIETPGSGHDHQLTVYIQHKNIYLYETFRILLNKNYEVVESVKKNPEKEK
ncbi:MAG: hypothetical protein GY874_19335 [Desulfobacteraceae bacterium]|nr:hypothetical protein [Desulfobacteraceae bacterium]